MEKTITPRITLASHLQTHRERLDPMLEDHQKTLFGPDGDDGLTFSAREIKTALVDIQKKLDDSVDDKKWFKHTIMGAAISAPITGIIAYLLSVIFR